MVLRQIRTAPVDDKPTAARMDGRHEAFQNRIGCGYGWCGRGEVVARHVQLANQN